MTQAQKLILLAKNEAGAFGLGDESQDDVVSAGGDPAIVADPQGHSSDK
jgi:hypothetical protein